MTQPTTTTRLLEHRNGVTFLDRMIDEATGYDQAVMGEFADFVYEFVFMTLGPTEG